MAIAFAPLNIDVKLPDINTVEAFFDEHRNKALDDDPNLTDPNEFLSVPIYLRASEEECTDNDILHYHFNNRWNTLQKSGNYLYNVDKIIPEIPHIIDQLPYKELTVVLLTLQQGYIPPRYDTEPEDVYHDKSEISIKNEPHRINVLLSNHDDHNFFVSEYEYSEKIYPDIPASRPCYAFTERYYWHGEKYTKPKRYYLKICGILDRDRHKAMIAESVEKWPEEIITFPDPPNEWLWTRHFSHDKFKFDRNPLSD